MTQASEIITRAFREGNFVSVSTNPTTDETAEGLSILQGIVNSLFAMVVGIRPRQWYIPSPQKTASVAANYPALPGDPGIHAPYDVTLPPANIRLMMKNPQPTRVYLQYQPEDGALVEYVDVGHTGDVILDANGALFGLTGSDTDVTISATFPASRNTPRRWVYRGDFGSWLEVSTLLTTSELPFPPSFDDYFIMLLAIRLSPRYGSAEPRGATVMRYKEMLDFIRLQYLQSGESLAGDMPHLADQAYGYRNDWDLNGFNTGSF